MKRIISVCLSLLMLILLPVPPVAAAEETEDPVSWEIDEETKTLTVFCEGDMPDYAAKSPFDAEDAKFRHVVIAPGCTAIGRNAFRNCNVNSLSLPEGLRKIGYQAFRMASIREPVVFPSTLEEIGDYAFENNSFSEITLPDNCRKLGTHAFSSCVYVKSLKLPANLTEMGASCFNQCGVVSGFTNSQGVPDTTTPIPIPEIIIPESLKDIPKMAFFNCSVQSVSFPSGLQSIGESAFSGCKNLTSVVLPEGLQSLGQQAFKQSGVTDLTLSAELHECGAMPFWGCNLDRVTLPDGLQEIPPHFFNGCNISELPLPEGLKKIGDGAFANAHTRNYTVILPDSLEEIGEGAFAGYVMPVLPAGLKKIGANAFSGAETPETVEWPAQYDSIPDGAFKDCDSLKTLTIPGTVRSIGQEAFAACSNLQTVQLAEGIESLGDYCFACCTLLSDISVPQSVKVCGRSIFLQARTLIQQAQASEQPFYILDGGYLMYCRPQEANVTVPDGVRFIGEHAFNHAEFQSYDQDSITKLVDKSEPEGYNDRALTGTKLTLYSLILDAYNDPNTEGQIAVYQPNTVTQTVTLPDSVLGFDKYAFSRMTALQSLSMTDSVTRIGDFAFHGCTALTEVSWSKNVESVGRYAIADTPYLSNFTDDFLMIGSCLYRCNSSTLFLQIPEGVTQICTEAFISSDGIMVVDFPSTLKRVEADAFYQCLNLWEINCNAEIEYIDDYACWACKILKYINGTPGTPAETYVENARLTMSHNRKLIFNAAKAFVPTGIDNTIIYGQDNWCFGNTSAAFGKSYAMTQTARDKLRDVMLTEKDWPDSAWNGSCYGLSTVLIMVKCGILKPEQLSAGAKTLHDAQPDDTLLSIINYYQFCGFTSAIANAEPSFEPQEMKMLRLIRACGHVTTGGAPSLVSVNTATGSHALVAYGLESGTWEFDGVTYHERILIWDSNSPAALSDEACVYYDPETLHYILPRYQVSYPDSERTITRVIETPELLNAEPYPDFPAETNDGDVNGNGWLDVGDAVLTARVVAEDKTLHLSDAARQCTDFNGDGKTDAADLREMIHSLAVLPWLEAVIRAQES